MSRIRVRLFGRFSIRCDEQTLPGLGANKVQELLCYVLLNWNRPHPREWLASHLWSDCSPEQSRKYLRKTLWQLQTVLSTDLAAADHVLAVEPEWIGLRMSPNLWLDVAVFEQAYVRVKGLQIRELDPHRVSLLQEAVELYQGDLLEGWSVVWCLGERERFQNMYVGILDRLMGYSELHHDYELGFLYGSLILRQDRASERTHQRMMRLHYLSGDRTGAIRQYERCAEALREELNIRPSRQTRLLHEQIQADQLGVPPAAAAPLTLPPVEKAAPLDEILDQLDQLLSTLGEAHQQAYQQIHAIEATLRRR